MVQQTNIEHEVMTIQNQVKSGVVSHYALEILSEGYFKAGSDYLNEVYYMLSEPVIVGFKVPDSTHDYEEKLNNLFLVLKSVGFKDVRVTHFGDSEKFKFKLFQPHKDLFEIESV